jgi:hypothetical protein
VDDIYGTNVGRLDDVWIDPGTGMPRWLLVKEGRFGGRTTLIPFEDATAGAGHVWIPYERDVVRHAPEVEPGAPLTQSVESALRDHYQGAGSKHGERRHTGSPRHAYRHVPMAPGQPPQHAHGPSANVPAYAHHPEPEAPAPRHHDAFALQGATHQRTYAHAGTPVSGLRPSPQQAAAPPSVEAGAPEALGIPVPPAQPQAGQDGGSAFGQARLQPAHDVAPGPTQAPPQQQPPPVSMPDVRQPHTSQPPRAPQAHQGPPQPPPRYQPPAYTPPQYAPPAYAAPPEHPQPPSYAPPQQQQPPPAAPQYAPPPAPPQPAPALRPAPVETDPEVAIPVIHALDRPQRVEIELAGELRISGELKGFSLKPVTPDPASGEQS